MKKLVFKVHNSDNQDILLQTISILHSQKITKFSASGPFFQASQ